MRERVPYRRLLVVGGPTAVGTNRGCAPTYRIASTIAWRGMPHSVPPGRDVRPPSATSPTMPALVGKPVPAGWLSPPRPFRQETAVTLVGSHEIPTVGLQLNYSLATKDGVTVTVALPAPDRRLLARPALPLVVCQVRFDEQPNIGSGKVGRDVYRALGGEAGGYPNFSQLRAERVTVTPAALPAEPVQRDAQRGWRYGSASEGDRILALLPDSLALETNHFPGWEAMGQSFREALAAVSQVIAPTAEERLGLRFINVLQAPDVTELGDWKNYVRPEALGLVGHEVVGAGVLASQQQVLLQLEEGLKCTVRLGPIRQDSGELTFLLDLDAFREASRPFDAETIAATAHMLNSVSVSLFQQLVTPKMLELLGQGESEGAG
jgi:uncharacterized protein (TIGR04255 family)